MTQSSCKRDTKSKSHPGVKLTPERFFSCKHPSDAYLLLAPDYMIGDFQSGTKFIFCSHDTRMKHTRARISFRLKTGMNSFWLEWLEWELNVTLVSCEQIQRNINYEDDMNLFQNENHSISLWIAPYWLCVYTDCIAAFLPGSLRMC